MESNEEDEKKNSHELHHLLTKREKFMSSLIAGGIAGAVAKTTIAPFDRTKINFQTNDRKFSYKKVISFIVHIVKNEGSTALWRGNSATLARIVPFASIQFAAHEQWKNLLKVDRITIHVNEGSKNLIKADYTPGRRFIAGSLAGATASFLTYPLDLARARMAVTNREVFRSFSQIFKNVIETKGYIGLYHGSLPTVLGTIPYAGFGFFTYESLKHIHRERTGNDEPSPFERMAFGGLAGLIGQSASYPLDIIRRRMQTAAVLHPPNVVYECRNIYSTFQYVIRQDGVRGLYKGLSMNWLKGPIAVGLSFTTFDLTQRELRRYLIS